MLETSLGTLGPELLARLESSVPENRARLVREFLLERLKQDEMAYSEVSPGYYAALEALVLNDVLPLYETYARSKEAILARQGRRRLWKYAAGAVLVLEAAQFVLSRGRALAPSISIPSALLEAALGAGVFFLAQWFDNWQVRYARSRFFEGLAEFEKRLEVDRQYDAFKDGTGADDLARAEAIEVVAQYATPEPFWRDYLTARRADPVNPEAVRRVGLPRFERFLARHAKGQYNDLGRRRRFDHLFLLAHEVFLKKSPNYAEGLLNPLLDSGPPSATPALLGTGGTTASYPAEATAGSAEDREPRGNTKERVRHA